MSSTPHDRYFKYVFSRAQPAASALRHLLPPALAHSLAFDTLLLLSGDSVDDTLSARHADLLYRVQLAGEPVLLYLLFEHQSSIDPLMPLRALAYALQVWVRHAGAEGLPLPPVVPFVLYHGKPSWSGATAFEQLVHFGLDHAAGAELRRFTPRFDLHLVDLGTLEPADLALDEPLAAVAVNVMQAVPRRDDLHEVIRAQRVNLRRIVARGDRGAMEATLTYIAQSNPRTDLQAVQNVMLTEVGAETEELLMSTFQQIFEEREARGRAQGIELGREEGREEGLAKGIELGRVEGQRRAVLNLLRLKFQNLVTPEVEARLEGADVALLDRWNGRILSAETLDGVFAADDA